MFPYLTKNELGHDCVLRLIPEDLSHVVSLLSGRLCLSALPAQSQISVSNCQSFGMPQDNLSACRLCSCCSLLQVPIACVHLREAQLLSHYSNATLLSHAGADVDARMRHLAAGGPDE